MLRESQEIHKCVTDCHDLTLAVEMTLYSNTNKQSNTKPTTLVFTKKN